MAPPSRRERPTPPPGHQCSPRSSRSTPPPCRGLAACTPSLADLAGSVLARPIRQGAGGVHDSREDAATALALVLHEVAEGPTPPLDPPDAKVAARAGRGGEAAAPRGVRG